MWFGSPSTAQFTEPGVRTGDEVNITASLYSDTDGHELIGAPTDGVIGSTTLSRGRIAIATSDVPGQIAATLPPESNVYTLTSQAPGCG